LLRRGNRAKPCGDWLLRIANKPSVSAGRAYAASAVTYTQIERCSVRL